MSNPTVSVLGAGGWGTALAILLARPERKIPLWGHDPIHVEDMVREGINAKYLSGVQLPSVIKPTADLSLAAQSEILFLAIPSRYLDAITSQLVELCGDRKPVLVSCTKGIEQDRGLLMSEVIRDRFSKSTIAVLSGPNLAGEIARGIPAAGVIGSADTQALTAVQALFAGTSFRAYTSGDIRGIQLGGALKNIFAIAAGVSDGLGLGENARAGLVTRSLTEMTRLGMAMGGGRETFGGLSGIGDLMVTCFSPSSRNHQVGFRLGQGESLESITTSMGSMVAEGIPTAMSAQAAARRLSVETPIIDEVSALLQGLKTPAAAMKSLMGRNLRAEEEV
ncbi:MAG: NAD(P)-dependent glycerol-3-phosphate dehydrogenase [Chthoniobacterales bacterium]|nr:NAD(P)-dependent glycerol-3-phosphate dehydrogenase [Chthoniobacterales bacterium]